MNRASNSPDRVGGKNNPIVMWTPDNSVSGGWVNCNCSKCQMPLAYWSVKGKALLKYAKPLCDLCKEKKK